MAVDVVERSLLDGVGAPLKPVTPNSKALNRLKIRIWRMGLRARFLLFQRHRHNTVVLETIVGRPFLVLPEVLNPKIFLTGEFLAEALSHDIDSLADNKPSQLVSPLIPPASIALDMGTGSGVGAVFAAHNASHVVAIDVNPAAVRCARINALLNHVEDRVDVVEGDLFEPVAGKRFDVILFNPPYFQGLARTNFERALWSDGLHDRFAEGLAGHLTQDGCALLLLSSAGQEITWLQALQNRGFGVTVVAQKRLPSETLTLFRASGGG